MNYMETLVQELNSYTDNLNDENLNKLKERLLKREKDTYGKQVTPRYCARLLLLWGNEGIELLKELAKTAPGLIYTAVMIETLFDTSLKQQNSLSFIDSSNPLVICPEITNEMAKLSSNAISEIINESLTNRDLFNTLLHAIYIHEQTSFRESQDTNDFSKFVFDILREGSIKINKTVIEQFNEMLLNPEGKEEDFQVYLTQNLALLDPLAKEIIPKQRLGLDFITDFVVRKLNDEYILVEIEKPTTPIFTKANDFSSQFTHALGQVLDFQEWVESNIAYAEKLMPNITSPTGLLILGHNQQLNDFQKKKLRRFNINNYGKVKVVTFDELVENAYKLYRNMFVKA